MWGRQRTLLSFASLSDPFANSASTMVAPTFYRNAERSLSVLRHGAERLQGGAQQQ